MDGGIWTKTLAELYLNQGHPEKALEIYYEILKREPSNREIREAINDLKGKMAHPSQPHFIDPPQDFTKKERIKTLQKWLDNIRLTRKQQDP